MVYETVIFGLRLGAACNHLEEFSPYRLQHPLLPQVLYVVWYVLLFRWSTDPTYLGHLSYL